MKVCLPSILIFSLILMIRCIDPYAPLEISNPESLLVVDGKIDVNKSSCTVVLSKTRPLDADDKENGIQYVPDAGVTLVDKNGNSWGLYFQDNRYMLSGFDIDKNTDYKLEIVTSDGEIYESEFVSVIPTPGIDSVSWKIKNNGIQIYVNTHDSENKTKYFKWEYEETWEFTSAYQSSLIYSSEFGLQIREDQIYRCWNTVHSIDILTGSSENLDRDVISEYPLLFIPGSDPRLGIKYSILVKQYAVSKEAYNYLTLLKKNTENIGTIFDPQPSVIKGNINCISDPEKIVIGFFYTLMSTSKRIFISEEETRPWRTNTGYENCKIDTLLSQQLPTVLETGKEIITQIRIPGGLTGYTVSTESCVDCTLRGVNIKPDFW